MPMVEEKEVLWSVPKDEHGKACVEKSGERREFCLAVSDGAEFLAFVQELQRQLMMLKTLWKAYRKFESGDANYANAAENLDNLSRELRKAEINTIKQARKFWKFTEHYDDKTSADAIEKMFAPNGDQFLSFIEACCEALSMREEERKNSLRERTVS